MQVLKKIISRCMHRVTCVLVAIIVVIMLFVQIASEQKRDYETATRTFMQIEQLLAQNQEEFDDVLEEYRETCLHNAEAIAYLIEHNPSVIEDLEELKKIAQFMEVDEIHIFDDTGRIYAGTHPQYYDYTFDSGEQMMFFKPMLKDRSLKLVQDITPNTAEAKLMQYSALWSENEEFILQVGMEPVNVMKTSKKNELSFLFSLFGVNHPEVGFFAVDAQSGEIVGSTETECVGKNLADVGLKLDDLSRHKGGFHAVVNGRHSYCVFQKSGANYIGRVISSLVLYRRIPGTVVAIAVCLIVIALILSRAVTRYMNRYVVDNIYSVNEKLHSIMQGNLDEEVDIHSSVEFSELSDYINRMKKRLLDSNSKMSYVLRKTNMYIGVYEYNQHMKRVRFTEYVPKILSLEYKEDEWLSSDYKAFQELIERMRQNPVPGENGIFERRGKYIKLEELNDNDGVFGVIIDVTEDLAKRKQIEVERDIDALTGLYNRRGLEQKLAQLFATPNTLGYSALVMIDADNLKVINDTYGHETGDAYLRKISELITSMETRKSVAARLGGDEFVLYLYQYQQEEALLEALHALDTIQEDCVASLNGEVTVPLRFSFGYSLVFGRTDYQNLLKEADERMYENKRKRKEAAAQLKKV